MISYSPYISHSAMGDRQSYGEVQAFTMCCMLPPTLALVDSLVIATTLCCFAPG